MTTTNQTNSSPDQAAAEVAERIRSGHVAAIGEGADLRAWVSALVLPSLAAAMAASPDATESDSSSAVMMPETGRLGAVRRFDAEGTSKDVVLLVSDADGWDSRAEDVAAAGGDARQQKGGRWCGSTVAAAFGVGKPAADA